MDLLNSVEQLEAHVRLMLDQNRLIEDEIDRVIKDDDAIARTLENRRSTSPVKGRGGDTADKNLRVAQRYNPPH